MQSTQGTIEFIIDIFLVQVSTYFYLQFLSLNEESWNQVRWPVVALSWKCKFLINSGWNVKHFLIMSKYILFIDENLNFIPHWATPFQGKEMNALEIAMNPRILILILVNFIELVQYYDYNSHQSKINSFVCIVYLFVLAFSQYDQSISLQQRIKISLENYLFCLMSENTKSKESDIPDGTIIKISGDYVLKQCLYRGKQHNIYLAVRISKPDTFYIVKLMNQHLEQVYYEEKMLKKLDKIPWVPQILLKGDERFLGQSYHYHIYPKLGPSLKICFHYMSKTFLVPTVAIIAIQFLGILEKLHSRLLVHRNLKPKKILTQGSQDSNLRTELHLIDYRYTTKFRSKNGKFAYSETKKFQNKLFVNKFSSVNTHLGLPCSPKDDLESLGYVLIYFLQRGNLFTKEGKNKEEQMKNFFDQKISLVHEKTFKDVPQEFIAYFQYVKNSNITSYPFPDYDFLKKVFRQILQRYNVTEKDYVYEWQLQKFDPRLNRAYKQFKSDNGSVDEIEIKKVQYLESMHSQTSQNYMQSVPAMDSEDEYEWTLRDRMDQIETSCYRFKSTLA